MGLVGEWVGLDEGLGGLEEELGGLEEELVGLEVEVVGLEVEFGGLEGVGSRDGDILGAEVLFNRLLELLCS